VPGSRGTYTDPTQWGEGMAIGRDEFGHGGVLQRFLVDTACCVRFYSRIPVPALPFEADPHAAPDFARIGSVVPMAGLVIAAGPALLLALSLVLGLGPWLSAALAIAALTLATGAFHEDGLADTADGFGGGATPERRLAIMRDSLIGSFGGSALVLAYALRISAVATLCERLPPAAVAITLVAVAALSRTAGLVPLVLLPPARTDGTSSSVGRPTQDALWAAGAAAVIIVAVGGVLAGTDPLGTVLMVLFAIAVSWLMTRVSNRLIGGQTGDVAGATQQLAEIAAFIGLLLTVEP
jgi:adenosylcobinamide-GDP ribazoletransferase